MASEMVDRICDLLMEHGCGNSQQCEKTARAAIAGMRDPTEAMIDAARAEMLMDPIRAANLWGVMIDAALTDKR